MKLINKQEIKLIKKYQKLNKDKDLMDKDIAVHLFNPTGAGDWYIYEYNEDTQIAFGYVSIFNDHCDEFGDFAVWELQEYKGRMGLGIERDLHWTPQPLKELKHLYINRQG